MKQEKILYHGEGVYIKRNSQRIMGSHKHKLHILHASFVLFVVTLKKL